ncbi:ethylene-responsive transcription factor ERF020-like [Solanum pennellii]|uniref:Ethylene-responsive transcription factor ERF020-like n=1 Tax=Solanum pennellii TaxID=28526 RepID=A0ABM1HQI0_SOLPN|nr:ethylene-responsive transcription factor ERF020-like [Solanum pennellii]
MSFGAKYRGIRKRKWGKWVSEIRVPGSSERLWLGTYTSPEAAAIAHDIAYYCLRPESSSSLHKLNFPSMLPPNVQPGMSPTSVQKVASDAAMAIDAQFLTTPTPAQKHVDNYGQNQDLNISVEDYQY